MKKLACWLSAAALILGLLNIHVQAAPTEVAAKSAVLMDAATGTVLFEQNPHAALRPASVTKVMTLLLIMEAIDQGRLHWEDTVTASANAAAKGGSQIFLKEGETMTVSDMVKSIAVSSANDCACAMAEHLAGSEEAFVEQMNRRAQALGMSDTHFVNCTGLDDEPNADTHLTSAWDIAIMSRALLTGHPKIKEFTTIWMDTVRGGAFGLSNTNKLIRFYPGATGLKTGFTASAGYCLSASAERDGMELIAVVMGSETSQERFTACKSLLDQGFANYALIAPEIAASQIPVKLGTAKTVNVVPAEQVQFLIDKSQKSSVHTQAQLNDAVTAPVSKGQRLGTLTVKAGQQVLQQIPLVAQEAVPKLTFGQLYLKILKTVAMARRTD